MARGHSVFVVTLSTHPIAAFTVKYECRDFLDLNYTRRPTNLRVYRLSDGNCGTQPINVTAEFGGLQEIA